MAVTQEDVDKLFNSLGKERADHKASKLKLAAAVAEVERLNEYISSVEVLAQFHVPAESQITYRAD